MPITSKTSSNRPKIHGKTITKDYSTKAYRVMDGGINRLALCVGSYEMLRKTEGNLKLCVQVWAPQH